MYAPSHKIGTLVSLPSFHPEGRSIYRVVSVIPETEYCQPIIGFEAVNPDGHYVKSGVGCRTLSDYNRNAWEL